MIVVIADDLTGAAEIGGIGLRYGLTVEICTNTDLRSAADLLIIATDTRSMPGNQALVSTAELTAKLVQIKPKQLFKKVDSVLRGHIMAELNIHLAHPGIQRALLVSANPALGRILTNGYYYVNDLPVHLSSFADDPEFAISSSNVFDMLKTARGEAIVCTTNDDLPGTGIIIGECATEQDLACWAAKADDRTLMAGGAGLFKAMLEKMGLTRNEHPAITHATAHPALFVCGSTFDQSKLAVKRAGDQNGPVSFMPVEIILHPDPPEQLFDDWAAEVIFLLEKYGRAIIAIHENITANITVTAADLREKSARAVEKILKQTTVKELLIEGGSTATAILDKLDIDRFVPVAEAAPGVIQFQPNIKHDFLLTLKPGSYSWPTHIWDF